LHLCGNGVEACRHNAKRPRKKDNKPIPTFASLFHGRKNIAVMCGKTSGNLLGIDCDSQSAYEIIGKKLDALELPYWTFTSHRGGCYLLRIIEGETTNVTKAANEKYTDVELWGNSHYVIVPMSVHPSGTYYEWRGGTEPADHYINDHETLPAVSVTALGWLGVTLLKNNKPQAKPFESFGLANKYFILSERNRKTLARGANEGERYTRLAALAYDLKANGLAHEDIEADFLNAAALCNPAYDKRKASGILKYAYAKERTRARIYSKSNEPTAQTQSLYAFVNSYDWKAIFKRKARTRRAVFVACIERSAIEGETFRAAVRELAETVNRKFQHVNVCLHDLINAGLLKVVVPWKKSSSGGNVYAFGDAVVQAPKKDSIPNTCNNNVSSWRYEKNTNTDEWKEGRIRAKRAGLCGYGSPESITG
jgi:hypothetical protein